MALPSTLYRFHIDLSDVDRGVYESLDLRVAMHPSESMPYLITRVLAYALNFQEGLEFSPGGLSDPDAPAMNISDPRGGFQLWIEIGNASARKLHKAAKLSKKVRVYTYKDPQALMREMSGGDIFHVDEIEVFSFAPEFLNRLGAKVARDNVWSIVHTDGSLTISAGTQSDEGELRRHSLSSVK